MMEGFEPAVLSVLKSSKNLKGAPDKKQGHDP